MRCPPRVRRRQDAVRQSDRYRIGPGRVAPVQALRPRALPGRFESTRRAVKAGRMTSAMRARGPKILQISFVWMPIM